MTKRELRKSQYAAECQRDREYAEARASIHAMSNALFACLQMGETVDQHDWHKLTSNCRKAEKLDSQTVNFNFGKRALWRNESEWKQ